jgi:hypothetical protein
MRDAAGLFVLSVFLYVPGACLLGFGLGPGHNGLLIGIGALMLAAGVPLRILSMRWRRGASNEPIGPPAST